MARARRRSSYQRSGAVAQSFWGKRWCKHLAKFSDYANRLPRGRRYLKAGAVRDMSIEEGHVRAQVHGTWLYTVDVRIKTLPAARREAIRKICVGQVKSLLALLQGQFSDEVMTTVTDPEKGLLPHPREISFRCDCPDRAVMCKHVAAVLFGIGARLDTEPELLFTLRGMDAQALVSGELGAMESGLGDGVTAEDGAELENEDLEEIFGIQLAELPPQALMDGGAPAEEDAEGHSQAEEGFDYSGAAIAALRRDFGYSHEEFADIMGVSSATIRRWERCFGKAGMRERFYRRLGWIWEIRNQLLENQEER